MDIRKFRADYLFTGSEILSSDNVLVTDDKGVIIEITDLKEAGDDVAVLEGMLTPGFINTHCHTELSHMKERISPGTGLVDFLTRVIRERNFKPEEVTHAMQAAEKEMYDAGIVAVGDICNTSDSTRIKRASKMSWFNFVEVIGFNGKDAEARINYASNVLSEFNQEAGGLGGQYYRSSISPHAPYSVSEELFKEINRVSAGNVVTIHNQESDAENQLYLRKSGQLFDLYKNLGIDPSSFQASNKTSLQTYLPWLNKVANVLLVHNTFSTEEDMMFVKRNEPASNIFFCICINANRYIQSVNPPIDLFRKHSCMITLGTDSYASNHQLNILAEIKTIHEQFPHIPLQELLNWATLNGAKALGMDGMIGSFETGKQPGIVLIDNIVDQHVSSTSTAKRLL